MKSFNSNLNFGNWFLCLTGALALSACGHDLDKNETRIKNENYQKVAVNKVDLIQSLARVERAANLLLQSEDKKAENLSTSAESATGFATAGESDDFSLTDDQEIVNKVAKKLAGKDSQGNYLCKIKMVITPDAITKTTETFISGENCPAFLYLKRVVPTADYRGDFSVNGEFEIKDAELSGMIDLKKGTVSGTGYHKVEPLSSQKAGVRTKSSIRLNFVNSGNQSFTLTANGNEFFDQYDYSMVGQRIYRLEFSDSTKDGLIDKYTEVAGSTQYNVKSLKDSSAAKFNGKGFKYETFRKFEELMGSFGLL